MKSIYNIKIKPYLKEIKKDNENGIDKKEICKKYGVKVSTFNKWLLEKEELNKFFKNKTSYEIKVKPYLKEIKELRRNNYTIKDISLFLKISYATLNSMISNNLEFKKFWKELRLEISEELKNKKKESIKEDIKIKEEFNANKFKNMVLDIMKENPFLFLYELYNKVKYIINYRKLILLISEIKEIKMIKSEGDDYKKSWVYLK